MVSYWVVRMKVESEATRESEDEYIEDWEIAIKAEKPFIGIGWSYAGNMTFFSMDDKDALIERLKSGFNQMPDGTYKHKEREEWVCKERSFGSYASIILSFINEIEINDIVILPTYPESSDSIEYFVGKIESGGYYLENPQDGAYVKTRRDVKWIGSIRREKLSTSLKHSLEAQATVFNIDKYEEEIQALLKDEPLKTAAISIEKKGDAIGKLSEIQKRLMDINSNDFEELVCNLLGMKYDVIENKGKGVADGGKDFVCLDSDLNGIVYRGQVKRISKPVGNAEILQLRGTLRENEEGIFVTTSHFTESAKEEANSVGKKRIHTIGGELLSQFILDFYNELDDKFKIILKIENSSHLPKPLETRRMFP